MLSIFFSDFFIHFIIQKSLILFPLGVAKYTKFKSPREKTGNMGEEGEEWLKATKYSNTKTKVICTLDCEVEEKES